MPQFRDPNEKRDFMLNTPIPRLVPKMALPSIAGMLVTSAYNLADTLFVSQLGTDATGAVGVNGSIDLIIMMAGSLLAVGAASLTSRLLGAKQDERAREVLSTCFFLALALGTLVLILGFTYQDKILLLLGANEEILPYSEQYCRYILLAAPFMATSFVLNQCLRAEGSAVFSMIGMVAGAVLNVGLDPLFIFTFGWGVAGAAIATGLSQCVGGLFPLVYFLRPNSSRLRLVRTRLELRPLLNACGNGSSELMSNISSSIVSMLYNFQLLKYIGEDGVSAYGVLMYVQFIFIAIDIGYSIGCAPVVGFHYGAQNHAELKNMLKKSVLLMCASGAVLTLLARLLAAPLAKLFVGYDEGLYTLTCHAFRLFSFAFLFAGFNIFASSFFTALGNGFISAAISFLRTLVFQTASVLILPLIFDVDGIWYAITVAEVFAVLLSVGFLLAKRKKYHYM